MREYETTLIIQPEISDEGVDSVKQRLDDVLANAGAIRLLYDDLGKRRMAYEIANFQKGRYVMLKFLDDGPVIPDLERAIRLEEGILRFLTIQVSEEVVDVAARKAAAAEEERIRAEKAAERARREAEDTARQEAEAAEAAREAKKRAAAEAARAAEDQGDASAGGDSDTPASQGAASAGGDPDTPASKGSASAGDDSGGPSDEGPDSGKPDAAKEDNG